MKIIHNTIKTAAVCLVAMAMMACSVDDFTYQDTARLRLEGPDIYAAGSDSLTFSFITYPEDTVSKEMDIDVIVMGTAIDYDRTAAVKVVADKTTASASDYEMPLTVTVPAGSAKGTLPVTLKRSTALQEKSVRLYIEIEANDDFQTGVNEQNHFTLIWNDVLTRPNNWDDLEEFFGTYSDVKYRFMIQNAGGISEFDADTMSWAQLHSLKIKFQNALNEYNEEHPGSPLRDDDGVLISFN